MDVNESKRTALLDQTAKHSNCSNGKMDGDISDTTTITVVKQQQLSTGKRNIFVDALAILFGISSWIGVTSIFLQLPLIVSTAPEGWSLPSYITITVQMGNIGSFAYVLYQKYSPKKIDDGLLIYIALFIGCVAAICMAFFYQVTISISSTTPHSVALLMFTLLFALVGCVSSVLFMPYMGRFRECYLVSYMLGMGLNGFLSSIMALVQGVGGPPQCIPNNSTIAGGPELIKYLPPPLFGTRLYFILVFVILMLGTIAFILLNNLSVCKREYAAGTIGMGNNFHYEKQSDDDGQKIPDDVLNLSTFNYVFLMAAVVGLSGLGNGLFPGLTSFSCLPYGNVTYHLAVTLAAIAAPCAGFIAMFVPHISIRVVRLLSLVASILAIYIFFVATQSPTPPLQHSLIGYVLIITSWTIFTCIINYMKISIVSIFRHQEGRSLVWVGTVNQLSSAVGSIVSFVLVNHTQIFVSYEPC